MLIKCPECYHDISSEALNCPFCGYPLSKNREQMDINDNIIAYLITGDYAGALKEASLIIESSDIDKCKQYVDDILVSNEDIRKEFMSSKKNNSEHKSTTTHQVKCPKCGSTQIQMVPRKWSLMTGLLTNKVERVCMNCKHKF